MRYGKDGLECDPQMQCTSSLFFVRGRDQHVLSYKQVNKTADISADRLKQSQEMKLSADSWCMYARHDSFLLFLHQEIDFLLKSLRNTRGWVITHVSIPCRWWHLSCLSRTSLLFACLRFILHRKRIVRLVVILIHEHRQVCLEIERWRKLYTSETSKMWTGFLTYNFDQKSYRHLSSNAV